MFLQNDDDYTPRSCSPASPWSKRFLAKAMSCGVAMRICLAKACGMESDPSTLKDWMLLWCAAPLHNSASLQPRDTPLNMPSKYSKYSKFASSSYTRVPDGCTLDFPLVGISSQQHVQCAAQYEEPTEPLAEIRNIQKSFDVWSSKMQWLAAFLTVNGHPKTERRWHDTHVHIHRLSMDREISKKDRG